MKSFNSSKKPANQAKVQTAPYRDNTTNLIYNLLFCDNLDLIKANSKEPYHYPLDILCSETSTEQELQKLIDDGSTESRMKALASNRLLANGHLPSKKELFGVIVEIGLDQGLDVLASFCDGTARYINQTGKMLIWESATKESSKLTGNLFTKSRNIVNKIGAWDKPRKPAPIKGNVRITFLVSDGLYFGEGPIDVLFIDPLASPALNCATELMQYLTEITLG